jgi:chemotaxis signal transduction protein
MAIQSPLRARRLAAAKSIEASQRLIVFKLGREMFALPLDLVHRAIVLDKVYGDPQDTGIALTIYQGREITVIDVGKRIFSNKSTVLDFDLGLDLLALEDVTRYGILLHTAEQRLVVLPIDSPPSIQTIRESTLRPLPEEYANRGKIRCVSSIAIDRADRPPIFLLDPTFLTADI